MREHIGSSSPMSHSLGTFLAKQESTAPGRDRKYRSGDCHTSDIGHWFAMTCVLGKQFDKQKFDSRESMVYFILQQTTLFCCKKSYYGI